MSMHVITIDGPAASGKSTVGRMLAEQLGYLFLDTGCMYRAVTLAVLRNEVDIMDETAVALQAEQRQIDIQPIGAHTDNRLYTVLLDGEDVTWAIRTPEVDANVSQVARYASVRREMVKRQRAFGQKGRVVMVGRDIGTVVMPDAPLKLYITATAEERAKRRWHDRQQQGHTEADYEMILADVLRRDELDSTRKHSPLRPAADAAIIDTTNRPPQTIVEEILSPDYFYRSVPAELL